jgi:hypothetical protein
MKTIVLRNAFIVTESLRKRFNEKTAPASNGCVEWIGASSKIGYGKIKLNGLATDSHVASWRIANGGQPVPIGFVVMHSCDNRKCVNPLHLSIGTQSQNMKDASLRGRLRDQKRNPNVAPKMGSNLVKDVMELHEAGLSALLFQGH